LDDRRPDRSSGLGFYYRSVCRRIIDAVARWALNYITVLVGSTRTISGARPAAVKEESRLGSQLLPGGSYLLQCTLSAGPSALQALQRAYNVHEKLERGRRATERFRCPEMPSKTIPAV